MNLERNEGLTFEGGYSRLRAYKKGELAAWMSFGFTLEQAKELATPVYDHTVHNLIVSLGKAVVGDLLIDEETTGLTYHAIGTGTTTPALADTTLTTEQERKAWTTRTRSANVITLSVFYTAAEATYNIKEVGIFGGSTATTSADSGKLSSHYLQAYDNSAGSNDLTFDYNLTIG